MAIQILNTYVVTCDKCDKQEQFTSVLEAHRAPLPHGWRKRSKLQEFDTLVAGLTTKRFVDSHYCSIECVPLDDRGEE
jgi:hypothetical protein